MIDLGDVKSRPTDRRLAMIASGTIVAASLVLVPFVDRALGESYTILAMVVAVSAAMLAVAAVLLLAQARVTESPSLLTLGAMYGAAALVMLPYLMLYRGLWPELGRLVGATAAAPSLLGLTWHLLLAGAGVAYVAARRAKPLPDARAFARVRRRTLAAALVGALLSVPCIVRLDLPAFYSGGHYTLVAVLASTVIIAVAVVSLIALYLRSRFRTVLDLLLGIATLCVIADVSLAILGGVPFSAGWYASRVSILVACGTVSIALILQAARLYAQLAKTADRLRDESMTDALTGLGNRRSFDLRLAQVFADGVRMSRGAAMLIIDVDQFKLFNDAYGHLGGDECLRDLASTVRGCVSRTRDLVARFGGEEFTVIMAETDMRGALIVAERIRSAIEGMGIPHSRAASHAAVTVSIGAVAVDDAATIATETFVEYADRALYAAKAGGRNCVVAWPMDAVSAPDLAGSVVA